MNRTNWAKLEGGICCLCGGKIIHRPKEKYSSYKKRRFCSVKCKMKALAKLNMGKKAHNNIQVPKECKFCKKIKMVAPCLKDRPFCDRNCMAGWLSKNQRGKNHWNWQGGITEKPARDILYKGYKEWREQIYKRDGFKCVLCGNNHSGELQAHHIKPRATYKELILDASNGLCVCKKCHKEIHYGTKI